MNEIFPQATAEVVQRYLDKKIREFETARILRFFQKRDANYEFIKRQNFLLSLNPKEQST